MRSLFVQTRFVAFFLCAFLFVGHLGAMPIRETTYHVVTTVPYAKDLMDSLSCHSSLLSAKSIIQVGTDPHTYVLTPKDRMDLENAQMIVAIGAGLDAWASKLVHKNKQILIQASNELIFRPLDPHGSPSNGGLKQDPHIWQSPSLTTQFVQVLSTEIKQHILKTLLKNADNQQKSRFLTEWDSCTKDYLTQIDTTVAKLQKEVAVIPQKDRVFATNHDSLGYFAQEFGFHIDSLLGLSDDAAPTAEQIKRVIQETERNHIKALFLETTGSPAAIQSLAKQTNVKIGGELYGDSFGPVGSGADTTLGMWASNVHTIVEALK